MARGADDLLGIVRGPVEILRREQEMVLARTQAVDNPEGIRLSSHDHYYDDLAHARFRTRVLDPTWRKYNAARAWKYAVKVMHIASRVFERKGRVRVLDTGCARALLRRVLAANFIPAEGCEVAYVGVDLRREPLDEVASGAWFYDTGGRLHLDALPTLLLHHDASRGLPFEDGSFDVVANLEMIKYLGDERAAWLLAETARVLAPGGVLFLSTERTDPAKARGRGVRGTWAARDIGRFLGDAGLEPMDVFGSEAFGPAIRRALLPRDLPTYRALARFHPPEVIEAFLGPLYPQAAASVLVTCRRAAAGAKPLDTPAGLNPRSAEAVPVGPDGGPATPGATLDERYSIERLVGRGKQSWVYRAHDALLDCSVALKLLVSDRFDTLEDLKREAEVATRIADPRAARWLGAGRLRDVPAWFVAYSWVEGIRAGDLLRNDAPGAALPPREALAAAKDLLGLVDLFERIEPGPDRALLHRDIHEENVILVPGGARLIDFGLARVVEHPAAAAAGCYPFTSNLGYDRFAVGILLHQMACGRYPWPGTGHRPPWGKPVAEFPVAAPEGVEAPLRRIIDRLLGCGREEAYRSAAEALADVERALAPAGGAASIPPLPPGEGPLAAGRPPGGVREPPPRPIQPPPEATSVDPAAAKALVRDIRSILAPGLLPPEADENVERDERGDLVLRTPGVRARRWSIEVDLAALPAAAGAAAAAEPGEAALRLLRTPVLDKAGRPVLPEVAGREGGARVVWRVAGRPYLGRFREVAVVFGPGSATLALSPAL